MSTASIEPPTKPMELVIELPDGLRIGVASSEYQIEGAISADGKGENCIDTSPIRNTDSWNCDEARKNNCLWMEDIKLLKDLGVDFYRFSISWTRISPNGDCYAGLNHAGIGHYRQIIATLLNEGITPMVQMYNWDMPEQLQELGGWANSVVIDYFIAYCRVLFEEYGSMVKYWYTVNEPQVVGEYDYGGSPPHSKDNPNPPGVEALGIGNYLAQHNQLIAHARVYRLYEKEFKKTQKGVIGLALQCFRAVPVTDADDKAAVQRALLFELDSMLHPLVKGDYPPQLKEIIDTNSRNEGRSTSRLPKFSPEDIELIKGSFDFIGLNQYSTLQIKKYLIGPQPSQPRGTEAAPWSYFEPDGIRKCLNYIREVYGKIPVYIYKSGCDDFGELANPHQIMYLQAYLKQVILAMEDGCNVLGYTVWRLMDSFEWSGGYTFRFGLCHVDFEDGDRKRNPKFSASELKKITKTRKITILLWPAKFKQAQTEIN